MEIGPRNTPNFPIDIVGVLVSNSLYGYINAIYDYVNSISGKNVGPRKLNVLPPGPRISLPVITSGKRGWPCP